MSSSPFWDSKTPILKKWCNFEAPMIKLQTNMLISLQNMMHGQSSWPTWQCEFLMNMSQLVLVLLLTNLYIVEGVGTSLGNLQFPTKLRIVVVWNLNPTLHYIQEVCSILFFTRINANLRHNENYPKLITHHTLFLTLPLALHLY
jgi:hypothetical protein